jgi:NADH-quinone oxidoreductase subunit N
MNVSYTELLRALLPETALVLGALVVLAVDLVAGRRGDTAGRIRTSVLLGLCAVLAAAYGSIAAGIGGAAFRGVLQLDELTLGTRLGVLVLTGLTLGLMPGTTRLRHTAEYVAVTLLGAAGFTLMAAAQQLLVAFLAIELASLSLYILAGFDKRSAASAEAGLKYYLTGAMSAAFLLFGFSLIYGLTGALDFTHISMQISLQGGSPLLVVALVMVVVAFGFKAAAAPFHLWAPDAYQGAPATSAALIASASKLAGFTIFLRLFWGAFMFGTGSALQWPVIIGWMPVLAVLALASMVVGNFGALAQSNVRRLLAYSAISHAGSLLLGVMVAGRAGPGPVFYYAATYGLATVGAFGVIAVVERAGRCQDLTDLAGLHKRSPLLAALLAIFILSLAGIPPLAGFFGKFAVFAAVLKTGSLAGPAGWLVFAAIALSAVALYYYLLVLKQALVADPRETTPIPVPLGAGLSLGLAAALLVYFGLFPTQLLRLFS